MTVKNKRAVQVVENDDCWEEEEDMLETDIAEEEDLFDDESDISDERDTADTVDAQSTGAFPKEVEDYLEEVKNTPLKKLFDEGKIILATSQSSEKPFGEAGVATLVDGGKFGQRWCFGEEVFQKLGLVDTVHIGFTPDKLLMGKNIPGQTKVFKLKKQGAKHIVYSAALVKEITKQLGLNFEGRTSITFYKIEYDYSFDEPIAMISK